MSKIFIDGAHGTTGLVIQGLLKPFIKAGSITLLSIDNYRNIGQRLEAFGQSDLSVICLPDEAAKEAVALAKTTKTRILDASSAHRTASWMTYGFPELSHGQPDMIRNAAYVTNPGCYATGAIAILKPLIDNALLDMRQDVTIIGASGYTGGGKNMIERHEVGGQAYAIENALVQYSMDARHKHVREIHTYSGLITAPTFVPQVLNIPRGMIVSVTFNSEAMKKLPEELHDAYMAAYHVPGSEVKVLPFHPPQSHVDFSRFAHLNTPSSTAPPLPELEMSISGWAGNGERQTTVKASLDNLGKGAGTQAVQNIRLMLNI